LPVVDCQCENKPRLATAKGYVVVRRLNRQLYLAACNPK
jgi:hypothetical protein